jgi:adenylosuccinate lyase
MPHKRNPVVCERISGLARVVRGHAQAALENVALWHERDISHSSAERIIVPDATGLLDFMLADAAWVLDGLVVYPDAMLDNVMSHGGIAFSQSALLALVEAGWSRDDAYRAVQAAAASAWDEGASFREALEADPLVREALGDDGLEALFDPQRFLRNLGGVFDALEKLPVSEGAPS